jgi:hypothetical protein
MKKLDYLKKITKIEDKTSQNGIKGKVVTTCVSVAANGSLIWKGLRSYLPSGKVFTCYEIYLETDECQKTKPYTGKKLKVIKESDYTKEQWKELSDKYNGGESCVN